MQYSFVIQSDKSKEPGTDVVSVVCTAVGDGTMRSDSKRFSTRAQAIAWANSWIDALPNYPS